MTAVTGLDTQLDDDEVEDKNGGTMAKIQWQFDFGDGLDEDEFGIGKGNNSLTNKDTPTPMASEETFHCCGRPSCQEGPSTLEEHKQGGPIVIDPGPLFAIGDVIWSNIVKHDLQHAFVMEVDHPCYKLRLANRTTVSTSTHDIWLWPQYATWAGNPSSFVPEQDDLFVDV